MVPAHLRFIIKWGREALIKSSLSHAHIYSLSFRDTHTHTHTHIKLDLGRCFGREAENPLGSICPDHGIRTGLPEEGLFKSSFEGSIRINQGKKDKRDGLVW